MPQREILWNVPSSAVAALYALSALSLAWIGWWFWQRSRRWSRGRPDANRLGRFAALSRVAAYLLTHERIRTDPYAGWMHLLLFWGFMILLIATTLVGVQHHSGIEFLTGTTYLIFSLCADLGG